VQENRSQGGAGASGGGKGAVARSLGSGVTSGGWRSAVTEGAHNFKTNFEEVAGSMVSPGRSVIESGRNLARYLAAASRSPDRFGVSGLGVKYLAAASRSPIRFRV
jgi:hypothetical protein